MKILDPNIVEQMFAKVEDILERHRMFGNALDSVMGIEKGHYNRNFAEGF